MQDRVKNEQNELFTELNWQSIDKVKWVGGTEQWEEQHEGAYSRGQEDID